MTNQSANIKVQSQSTSNQTILFSLQSYPRQFKTTVAFQGLLRTPDTLPPHFSFGRRCCNCIGNYWRSYILNFYRLLESLYCQLADQNAYPVQSRCFRANFGLARSQLTVFSWFLQGPAAFFLLSSSGFFICFNRLSSLVQISLNYQDGQRHLGDKLQQTINPMSHGRPQAEPCQLTFLHYLNKLLSQSPPPLFTAALSK